MRMAPQQSNSPNGDQHHRPGETRTGVIYKRMVSSLTEVSCGPSLFFFSNAKKIAFVFLIRVNLGATTLKLKKPAAQVIGCARWRPLLYVL